MPTINDRILVLLKRHKISGAQLCKEADIPSSTYSETMSGKYDWKLKHIMNIANYFQVSVDWLLYGERKINVLNDATVKYLSIDEILDNKTPLFPEFPIISHIPAGVAEIKSQEYPEYKSLDYDPRKYFWLKVDDENGFSMLPFLKPGELVLCANEVKKLKDGDMVAVLYDDSHGAVKIINLTHGMKDVVILESINPGERPLMLKRSQVKAIYKVVLISKI